MSSHGDRFRSRAGLFPQGLKFPGFQGLCMGGLDSSAAYLSGAMTSPAAVMVLSSTSCGDVTPSPQGQFTFARQRDAKDGGAPTFPPFPVRPLFGGAGAQDPYGPLSSPLLSLHHPALLASHALGRSYLGGAFRPLDGGGAGFHGSAFLPAAKCMKMDDAGGGQQPPGSQMLLPPYYHGGFRSPPSSGGAAGAYLVDGKESEDQSGDSGPDRMSETPGLSSEGSRSIERSTPEERGGTPKRPKKYLAEGQTPYCPICGSSLQLSELPSHFEMEVERLLEMSKCISQQLEVTSLHSPFSSPLCMVRKDDKGKPESRWETYQRVKGNRTTRLTSRCVIKRKKWGEEPTSPGCSDRPPHPELLAAALRKRESGGEPDGGVLDNRATAEFNWAVTARLHAIAQLQRGLTEYGNRKFEAPDDENQELNVDGDDSATYGQPHYTEADVITCSTEEAASDNKDQIRRLQASESNYPRRSDSSPWSANGGNTNGEGQEVTSTCVSNNDTSGEFSPSDKEATKVPKEGGGEGIKDGLESGIKCLICMEPFIKPVVSICCWHVHCEECWLKTLGTKKLCPQCNMITSPRDLRRIYL